MMAEEDKITMRQKEVSRLCVIRQTINKAITQVSAADVLVGSVRLAHWGEMVQMDGSHHDWFEGRGPGCVLMGYVDDATGSVYGHFYNYEEELNDIRPMSHFEKSLEELCVEVMHAYSP
jgi:hypothetical protein